MDTKYQALEKRIAALEGQLKDDKKKLNFAVDSWITVLLQFVDDFAISNPKIDKLVEELRQKE